MKKDARFWILVGALVLVGGLFAGLIWSVMAAPTEPTVNQVSANVTVTGGGNESAAVDASVGDKPGVGDAALGSSPVAPPPPIMPADVDSVIRDAEAEMRNAMAAAERAAGDARARTERLQREARARTERARRRAAQQAVGDKPTDDGKPPADW